MREIKFRAWDAEQKKIFAADELKNLWSMDSEFWEGSCNNPHLIAINQAYRGDDLEITISPDHENALMQYTGLKDKNDKEIYEGDILADEHTTVAIHWCADCAGFQMLVKGNKCYGPKCEQKTGWWLMVDEANEDWEVIGNIHENPELLEANQ